ncbi:fungal specific transcription factor domain-containing protein [Aspergillus clavatus NRRL 1]|uniref:Xylanolytic transcriptional activator regulatory domain-containing protein n=1 Tax=Aspergillus clavatus (strain ATCC 1007 / CBS 513.65 / DSM 816 / NCTC 3887 / NRRL 1 / QM 1276 / 107) TaxID=344612 RepID=A1CB36_ASPCL|nr:uncharacterized protein ACLA_013910 [Aspergillus clavatus NRRL 1]EAW12954.1 hypothetical protein ACLA_013910 [Aspergillus clavatus NRRL 1]
MFNHQFQALGKFDAKEVEPSLQNVDTRSEFASIFKDCRQLRQVIKDQESVRLNHPVPDLLGTLPAQSVCEVLVNAYFRTFEPIYRVIHVPSFWKEYRQLWTQPQSTPTHFLMKLVLILALGTTFYPDRNNRVHLRRLAHTWIYAAQWWLVGPSEKSTVNLDGLQVGCLLLLARQIKGALSFDVNTSLGLEIVTQLEEEASTRPVGSSPPFIVDSLDELAKAHRAPLIRSLEHIQEQLLQVIALGNPSLKRYNFLSAILSQIRAMESGQPIPPAIYETVKESLKKCYSLLQDSIESLGFDFALTHRLGP